MHSTTLFTLFATLTTVTFGLMIPQENALMRRDYDELYVDLAGCGSPQVSAGEVAFVYLGNGVAPYSLNAVNATTGELIQAIDTNITTSRYTWYAYGPPAGTVFNLAITDSSGSTAESTSTYTMGDHPGRLRE